MRKLPLNSLLLGACVLAASAPAYAAPTDNWYVTPMISLVEADRDRNAGDDLGFSLGLGKAISDSWNIEAAWSHDKLDRKNAGDAFKQNGLGIDAVYLMNRGGVSPFGLIGAGVLRTSFAGDSNNNAMANAGVGVLAPLDDTNASVRVEARYRWDMDNNSIASEERFTDWMISAGLSIALGKTAAPAAKVAAAPAPAPAPRPADDDRDGVANDLDRCPDTAPGVKVDARGCELDSDNDGVADSQDRCPATTSGAKVDARGCEPDSDGDGVVDGKDRCPGTVSGAKVDAQGCELDSDGDGIVDSKDRCPGTRAGARTDNQGCELQEKIVLKGVTFANNSAELIGDSKTTLDEVASTLKRHSDMKVEIAGYTDNRGSANLNQKLSESRAQAVRAYLIASGVKAENLTAKGYGMMNPIAGNDTATGRAENRRVELHILQ